MKKDLAKRWATELDYSINLSLKKENWQDKSRVNVRWSNHPFGLTVEGKLDFRGFPLREPLKYQYLDGIDFSFLKAISGPTEGYGLSRGLTGINASVLENCKFVEADLPANLAEKFSRCDFEGASFNAARMNGEFSECNFKKCRMQNVLTQGAKFVNCDFSDANLSKANFYACIFEGCIFDGAKFSGSNFSGSTFLDAKPTEAQLSSCAVAEKIKFM
jgi:fluoroquinolone resistance protein